MMTLAQKYPDAHANIQRRGYVHIAALMDRFGKASEMDRALGLKTATSSWCTQKSVPSSVSEESAKRVIAGGAGKSTVLQPATQSAPVEIKAEPETGNDPLMVVCPSGRQGKVMKVLEMMGCEVVQI